MNSGVCTVAVDVGNSALKLCVRKSESYPFERDSAERYKTPVEHSIFIDESSWHEAAISWVRDHVECGQTQWRIASVHREAADQLTREIIRDDAGASIRLITSKDVPIEVDVDEPHRVGVDRLLGAYAAWNRCKKAVVVVDAGSAITVDWVCSEGRFHGGAILPGLGLQTRALATGTDALPNIRWQSVEAIADKNRKADHRLIPAKNTADAIRLGVLTSATSAIDRLAEDYTSISQDAGNDDSAGGAVIDHVLVLTGGDAKFISKYLRHQHELVSNLVCRGLIDLPKR